MAIISALGRLRQDDGEFETSMVYYKETMSPKHTNHTKNTFWGASHLFDMFLGSRDKSQMPNLSPPRNYSLEGGVYKSCWMVV